MCSFAVIPYANALPLTHFIRNVWPEANLIERKPCQMLAELEKGRVDAALLSVVDYLASDDLEIITNLGIAARGPVQSVLLQCQRPLEQVEKFALDPESRTANVLAQVLLAKHFSIEKEIVLVPPEVPADAAVVIGDRALQDSPAFESYDLAQQWQLMTGLGFVFAVWVCRAGQPNKDELRKVLVEAKELGIRHLSYLAELGARKLGLSMSRCHYYLNSCIQYELGPNELDGMKLFAELLKESVWVDREKVLEEAFE